MRILARFDCVICFLIKKKLKITNELNKNPQTIAAYLKRIRKNKREYFFVKIDNDLCFEKGSKEKSFVQFVSNSL
jgi:hypothetical protein